MKGDSNLGQTDKTVETEPLKGGSETENTYERRATLRGAYLHVDTDNLANTSARSSVMSITTTNGSPPVSNASRSSKVLPSRPSSEVASSSRNSKVLLSRAASEVSSSASTSKNSGSTPSTPASVLNLREIVDKQASRKRLVEYTGPAGLEQYFQSSLVGQRLAEHTMVNPQNGEKVNIESLPGEYALILNIGSKVPLVPLQVHKQHLHQHELPFYQIHLGAKMQALIPSTPMFGQHVVKDNAFNSIAGKNIFTLTDDTITGFLKKMPGLPQKCGSVMLIVKDKEIKAAFVKEFTDEKEAKEQGSFKAEEVSLFIEYAKDYKQQPNKPGQGAQMNIIEDGLGVQQGSGSSGNSSTPLGNDDSGKKKRCCLVM